MKHLTNIGLLAVFTLMSVLNLANAGDEISASDERRLKEAVWTASQQWTTAFNNGKAEDAAALYEESAVMVAKPFGTFKGRDNIELFWRDLIAKGFAEVVYIDPVLTVISATEAKISSYWRMNSAKGIITNEYWVLQPDGTAKLREDHFEVQP